jgi:hypothetical protein
VHRIVVLAIVVVLAALSAWPPSAGAQAPALVLLLATDAPEYGAGATVSFTVAVDNPSDAPLTVTFPSAQLFDITVSAGQQELWRWSSERDFAQAEVERTFPPGVTLLGRATWDLRDGSGTPLPAGPYQIQGSLATAPRQPGNVLLVRLL